MLSLSGFELYCRWVPLHLESQTGHNLLSRGVWFYQFQSLAIISLLLFTRNFTKAFPSVVGAMLLHGGKNIVM